MSRSARNGSGGGRRAWYSRTFIDQLAGQVRLKHLRRVKRGDRARERIQVENDKVRLLTHLEGAGFLFAVHLKRGADRVRPYQGRHVEREIREHRPRVGTPRIF